MNHLYLLLISGILILQFCGGLHRTSQKPMPTTTPPQLELTVDQNSDPYTIPVSFTLNIPKNYIPSCARLIVIPHFSAQGYDQKLTPVIIQGKKHHTIEQRLSELEGISPDYPEAKRYVSDGNEIQIRINENVPFQTWMPTSNLVLHSTLEACDQSVTLPQQILATGVAYLPLAPGPVVVKYIKKTVTRKEEGFAHFYYPVNRYNVDPALYNNQAQLDSMTNLIRNTMNDTLMHVNRIVITGICSPDGSWKYNETLAKERANYIKNYLVNNLKIDNNLITTNYIAEDWDELIKLIKASSMTNKEEVLDLIDRISDDDQREIALRKLPQYTYIKQNFYPQLRKVTYEIFYTVEETEEVIEPVSVN